MKRLTFTIAICVAIFSGTSIPSSATELWSVLVPNAKHVRTSWHHWNWRDRCAWAGYYCLYAWHGYVFHYSWDDRDYAYGYYLHRYRQNF
jgi:hypothetical protein